MRYLLTDEAEAPVLSDALVGLPQHRVKGLVAVSERRSGVTGDGEGSNVNLREIRKTEKKLNLFFVENNRVCRCFYLFFNANFASFEHLVALPRSSILKHFHTFSFTY